MSRATGQCNRQERAGWAEIALGLVHNSIHHPLIEVVDVELLGVVLRQKSKGPIERSEKYSDACREKGLTCGDLLTPDAYPGPLHVERVFFRGLHGKFLRVRTRACEESVVCSEPHRLPSKWAGPATRTQGMPIHRTARTIDSSSSEGCICDSIPCLWLPQELWKQM